MIEDNYYDVMKIEELRISIDETYVLMVASMDKFEEISNKLNEK